jgi:hypothetical protein
MQSILRKNTILVIGGAGYTSSIILNLLIEEKLSHNRAANDLVDRNNDLISTRKLLIELLSCSNKQLMN